MADFAGSAKFLNAEVTRYERQWMKTVYPERWAANGDHLYNVGDLRLGEKRVIIPRIDYAGKATIHTGKATDIPLLQLATTADQYNARVIVMGAKWDAIADIAAEEVANLNGLLPERNTVQMLMDGLSDKISEKEHELVVFGNRAEGMDGLFSGQRVDTLDIPAGTNLHEEPALDLFDRIRGLLKEFHKRSLLTAMATKMLCTIDLYDSLCRKFPDSEGTPLERLTRAGRGMYVREIEPVNELTSDLLEQFGVHTPGANRDRFMVYEDRIPEEGEVTRPGIMRQFFAMDRTPVRQDSDLGYSMTAYCATTEVQFREPFRALYIDYDKFAA